MAEQQNAPADDDGPAVDADGNPLPRQDALAGGAVIQVSATLIPGSARATKGEPE